MSNDVVEVTIASSVITGLIKTPFFGVQKRALPGGGWLVP
jgi:hypothetical protein